MTIRDAYNQYRTMVDEGSDAFLTPPMFLVRYTLARRGWLKAKAQETETEYVNRLTAPFQAKPLVVTQNLSGGIPLSGLETVAFVRAVICDFALGNGTLKNRPATRLNDDRFALIMGDPTKRPGDWWPAYQETDKVLTIVSDSVPQKVTVRYLKDFPAPARLTATEASDLAESPRAVDEILLRVVSGADWTTQNTGRYNPVASRETPLAESNT